MSFRGRACVALLLVLPGLAGCARPFAGPKTLAAVGAGLLVGGGTTWVVGERGNHDSLATAGVATTALGAALVLAAGGWLAASVACSDDIDCPRNEECREIPAQPGGYPYKQCMSRQGP
jgi:hypothetical protein